MQIVDYGRSVPWGYSPPVAYPVLGFPSSNVLGQFGLNVPAGGSVLLHATLGIEVTLGQPDISLTFIRNGERIHSAKGEGLKINASDAISFYFVDSDVPAGYYAYSLTSSVANDFAGNRADVVGPIVFLGLSFV